MMQLQAKEWQGLSTKQQKLEKSKEMHSPRAFRGRMTLQREKYRHLDFRCLASRRVREYIPVVLSHPVGGALLQQP